MLCSIYNDSSRQQALSVVTYVEVRFWNEIKRRPKRRLHFVAGFHVRKSSVGVRVSGQQQRMHVGLFV